MSLYPLVVPYILLQSPYILLQSPYILLQSPYTLLQSPYIILQSPYTLLQSPYILCSLLMSSCSSLYSLFVFIYPSVSLSILLYPRVSFQCARPRSLDVPARQGGPLDVPYPVAQRPGHLHHLDHHRRPAQPRHCPQVPHEPLHVNSLYYLSLVAFLFVSPFHPSPASLSASLPSSCLLLVSSSFFPSPSLHHRPPVCLSVYILKLY